jgi:hypothetical protein
MLVLRGMRPLSCLALSCLALVACNKSDVGQDCPELLGEEASANVPDASRTETAEVVAQDVTFPCDELLCVATAGRSGYCSKKCREDSGCPSGFVCREVQPVGVFAKEKFCVWAPCTKAKDCGDTKEFCCLPMQGADPGQSPTYCAFANNGKCG